MIEEGRAPQKISMHLLHSQLVLSGINSTMVSHDDLCARMPKEDSAQISTNELILEKAQQ